MSRNSNIKKIDHVNIVLLSGRVDIIAAEAIESEINTLFSNGETKIIFDMGDVAYFSSSGVRMLISAKNRIQELGGEIALSNVNSTAEKIMTTLGLIDKYKIYPDIKTALKDFN